MRREEAVHRSPGQAAEVHTEEACRSQAAAERSHPFHRTQEQRPGCLGNHEVHRVLGSGLVAGNGEEAGLEGSRREVGRVAAAAAAAAGQAGLGIAVAVGSELAVGEGASTASDVSQGPVHVQFTPMSTLRTLASLNSVYVWFIHEYVAHSKPLCRLQIMLSPCSSRNLNVSTQASSDVHSPWITAQTWPCNNYTTRCTS
jgi:hypothetical protein